MLSCKPIEIRERSENIPIKKNLSTTLKIESPKGEYSLKQNFFDPSKSSPPNDFMNKLEMRMKIYNSNFYINHVDKRDDSLDSE
jgi:hypothetical protein